MRFNLRYILLIKVFCDGTYVVILFIECNFGWALQQGNNYSYRFLNRIYKIPLYFIKNQYSGGSDANSNEST